MFYLQNFDIMDIYIYGMKGEEKKEEKVTYMKVNTCCKVHSVNVTEHTVQFSYTCQLGVLYVTCLTCDVIFHTCANIVCTLAQIIHQP